MHTMNNAVKLAAECVGSVAELSRLLNVSRMTIYNWIKFGVPMDRVVEIESITGGKVTREQLLPELFKRAA